MTTDADPTRAFRVQNVVNLIRGAGMHAGLVPAELVDDVAAALPGDLAATVLAAAGRPGFLGDPQTARWPGSIAALGDSRGPSAQMEPAPYELTGGAPDATIMLGRFDGNPGVTYWRRKSPGGTYPAPTPSMFTTGTVPAFCGSGVDPTLLLRVRWVNRHSAAFSESRAFVLRCIEESDDPEAPRQLQNDAGSAALASYFDRIKEWVMSRPDQDTPVTDDEMARLFSPGAKA